MVWRASRTLDAGSDHAFHERAHGRGVDGELATKPGRRCARSLRPTSESL